MRRFLLISASVFMLASPAFAIDFSQPVEDGLGGKIMDPAKGKDVKATLGQIVAKALFEPIDLKLSDEDKFKRGMLGTKVAQGGEISLTAEETVLVKNAVANRWPPQIVYQVWLILDPGSKPEAPKEEPKP